jgi:hypothetical protein
MCFRKKDHAKDKSKKIDKEMHTLKAKETQITSLLLLGGTNVIFNHLQGLGSLENLLFSNS